MVSFASGPNARFKDNMPVSYAAVPDLASFCTLERVEVIVEGASPQERVAHVRAYAGQSAVSCLRLAKSFLPAARGMRMMSFRLWSIGCISSSSSTIGVDEQT